MTILTISIWQCYPIFTEIDFGFLEKSKNRAIGRFRSIGAWLRPKARYPVGKHLVCEMRYSQRFEGLELAAAGLYPEEPKPN